MRYEEEMKNCEAERTVLNKDIEQALHAAFEHKEYMAEIFENTHSDVSEITSSALALVV